MLIKELRVVLPLSLEECRVAHVFAPIKFRETHQSNTVSTTLDAYTYPTLQSTPSTVKSAAQSTSQSTTQSVQSLSQSTPSSTEDSVNQSVYPNLFTHKRYTVHPAIPNWAKAFIGDSRLVVESKIWDEFPHTLIVYHIPILKEKVIFTVESRIFENDRGDQHNALNLSANELRDRVIVHGDISSKDVIDQFDSPKPSMPARVTQAMATSGDWRCSCSPSVCVYTVMRVHVGVWGVQQKAEQLIAAQLQELGMRMLFYTTGFIDEWSAKTWEQACQLEIEGAQRKGAAQRERVEQTPVEYLTQLQTAGANHSAGNNKARSTRSRM